MFERNIEFIAPQDYVDLKDNYPIPCKLQIPQWYKDLEHTPLDLTIKGCMPFLDTLTTGYILKMPIDMYIEHNVPDPKGTLATGKTVGLRGLLGDLGDGLNVTQQNNQDFHPLKQVGDKCPFGQKNSNLVIHKIRNPWVIKTPPGYSCLFLPPMNNADDRFSIIPGIVDTDTFPTEVNFPFIMNGDKYPYQKTTIKEGTPYVQVIPFKKESWKMKVKSRPKKEANAAKWWTTSKVIHVYKTRFWNKISWK
jgi:hypothetical protein